MLPNPRAAQGVLSSFFIIFFVLFFTDGLHFKIIRFNHTNRTYTVRVFENMFSCLIFVRRIVKVTKSNAQTFPFTENIDILYYTRLSQ